MPRSKYVSFSMLVPGVYDVTPDHQPILGAIPGTTTSSWPWVQRSRVHDRAGVARITADAVEGRHDEAIDVLGVDRFAGPARARAAARLT